MFGWFKKNYKESHVFQGDLDLTPYISILSIVKNNNPVYLNLKKENFFIKDRDGDLKLNGRVAIFKFNDESGNIIEFFVAFYGEFSEGWSSTNQEMLSGFELVARSIFDLINKNKIKLFSPRAVYQTQYIYTYRCFLLEDKIVTYNLSFTDGYVITKSMIKNMTGNEAVEHLASSQAKK